MRNEIESAIAALTLKHGLITPAMAVQVLDDTKEAPVKVLFDRFSALVAEADLLASIAKEIQVEYVDLNSRSETRVADAVVIEKSGVEFLEEHTVLPLVSPSGEKTLAMANPTNFDAINRIRGLAGGNVSIALASTAQIQAQIISIVAGMKTDIQPGPNAVPEWIDALLTYSLAQRTSDIHFRFGSNKELSVRLRVDGVLQRISIPKAIEGKEREVVASVLSRSSTIDVSNQNEPQDGTFSFEAGGRTIDVRIGLLPQVTGANVTLRILDSSSIQKRPEEMGLRLEHVAKLRSVMKDPQGCIVCVGPTGSGKTTTLYSLLREVDAVSKNVLTVEDPVEYRLPNVGQTQIRNDLGEKSLTWEKALRSILRSDPDVVLVGEIRDPDVAKVAMEAAITGHLVLTTLHAQTAPGAWSRLGQMGVPGYLSSEAISAVISQRLVRRVHDCAEITPLSAEERSKIKAWGFEAPDTGVHAVGCSGCSGTGYLGRIAIAELLVPNDAFRDLASNPNAPQSAIRDAAVHSGWEPLSNDAYRAFLEGKTTLAEVERVVGSSESEEAFELPDMTFGDS